MPLVAVLLERDNLFQRCAVEWECNVYISTQLFGLFVPALPMIMLVVYVQSRATTDGWIIYSQITRVIRKSAAQGKRLNHLSFVFSCSKFDARQSPRNCGRAQ